MHPIMTSHQVAELLQCKPETIDAMARDHKLPAVKLGGSWVFTADTLVPAINRHQCGIAQYAEIRNNESWYTHWCPLPKFREDQKT